MAPVKAPFSWPEQFAFKEASRYSGAVEPDEGALVAAAEVVDGAGDEFLACSCLAQQ
jgi:hypothetical protein